MTDHPDSAPKLEFSRPVRADAVAADEMVQTIEASATERDALARRLELEAVDCLKAAVRLRRAMGGEMIRVSGRLEADVVQTCVVTLEPVKAHVSEEFSALFSPNAATHDVDLGGEIDVEFSLESEMEDAPEPLVNGKIDIGELTTQHLSLALDPYPRAPGVDFIEHVEHDEAEEAPSPFAALARRDRKH
ncbi:MAG TPA: DUF177 domain-containing protein [Azospirillaceae bacterium]|nr:DUF177 domain-containing protein [Azospirillaceae bacterium]